MGEGLDSHGGVTRCREGVEVYLVMGYWSGRVAAVSIAHMYPGSESLMKSSWRL